MLTDYEKKSDRPRYTATELHQCARREVSWRKQVYSNRVTTGRMTPAQAKAELGKMQQIADHFAALAEKERLL